MPAGAGEQQEGARRAVAADLDVLSAFAGDAHAELVPARGGQLWSVREARPRPARAWLVEALEDPGQLVLVGTLDDVAVGYAVVRAESLRDGTVLGVVDDLWVDGGARSVGVGEALMEQVLAWCRQVGCVGVDALALPGLRGTKNFFERFGFTARALVVHQPLTDSGADPLAVDDTSGGEAS